MLANVVAGLLILIALSAVYLYVQQDKQMKK